MKVKFSYNENTLVDTYKGYEPQTMRQYLGTEKSRNNIGAEDFAANLPANTDVQLEIDVDPEKFRRATQQDADYFEGSEGDVLCPVKFPVSNFGYGGCEMASEHIWAETKADGSFDFCLMRWDENTIEKIRVDFDEESKKELTAAVKDYINKAEELLAEREEDKEL